MVFPCGGNRAVRGYAPDTPAPGCARRPPLLAPRGGCAFIGISVAIFHFAVKSFSRGKGDSATAAAAYRAGLALDDPMTGERHDYTRRAGVVSVDMLAPAGAPDWAMDPHQVWAKVEENETRKNARVAREIVIALPHELDPMARRDLARDVGQLLVDRYDVVAQVAIHAPDKGGDARNHHAHILFTPRQIGVDGFGAYAAKVYDDFKAGPEEIKAMRVEIAARFNRALARAQLDARVDHRTLVDQKAEAADRGDFKAVATLDRMPTRHEGKATTQARRRGERAPRARRNDRRQRANAARLDAHEARFQRLKDAAQADGRLGPIDEQAAHARALLERTEAGRARLAQAIPPRAAVPARAKRPAPHQAGSSVPRRAAKVAGHRAKGSVPQLAPQVHTRVTGNGTKESEQAARVANAWLATLEKDLADLLNKALAWGQRHADPLARALARDYLHAEGEAQVATVLRDQAAADLKQARRDRHDARHYRDKGQAGLKGAGKLAERLGWTPKSLRDLQDAAKLSEEQVVMIKQSERFAIAEQEKASREAERQRQRLLQAFQKAHPAEDFRFPEQWPPTAPVATPEPSPRKQMEANSTFQSPRLDPPRFARPKRPSL